MRCQSDALHTADVVLLDDRQLRALAHPMGDRPSEVLDSEVWFHR